MSNGCLEVLLIASCYVALYLSILGSIININSRDQEINLGCGKTCFLYGRQCTSNRKLSMFPNFHLEGGRGGLGLGERDYS